MNKLIHGSIKMEPDSKSTKDPSHHHNITRSLLTMDLCDGIIGKITNDLRHSNFCDDFDITFMKLWGNSIIYWGILSIISEQIYINKAPLPDILPKSDYFSVYVFFQSNSAFLGLKTAKKHAVSTLKNQKSKQANQEGYILPGTPTQGSSPLYALPNANTFSVYAIQQNDRNPGQITMKIKIRTIHVWQYHKPGPNVFTGGGLIMRTLL